MRKKWIWIMALAVGLVCLFAGTAWAELSTNLSVKIEYNKNNKQLVASRTYVDEEGNPVIASDKGYATITYKYGTKNVVKKTEFLDEKGNPVDCLDGYCTKVCSYSGTTLTKTSYFTAAGDPAMGPDGYSVQKIKYNEKGKHLSTWEYDTEGNPVNLHRITEYMGGNLPNAVRSDSWYDAEDNLADGPEGYARVEYAYSGKNICKTAYYKADGSLYYNPKTHFAIKEEKYEDFKSRELNYYGADGELAAGPEGYATAKYTYFAADVGNEKLTMFYNADGSLYFNQQGYCGFRRRLGKSNRVMDESYYAGEGIRGYCTDGYSRVTTDYTLQGDVSVQRFYDAEDNLMVVPNLGYAMVKNTYKNQRLIQTEYFDENKELIRGKDGYAVAVYRYDRKACPAETAYYDADGKTLVACKDGYARIQYTCDKNKQVIAEQYFDAAGNPVVVRDNADEIHYSWSGNNKTGESYWQQGEPVTNGKGYHELRQEFTGDNKLAAQFFLDVKGKLTELQDGYAKIELLYDTAGKAMATLYYNGNGELMKAPGKEYAYVLTISQKERDMLEGEAAEQDGGAQKEKTEETEQEKAQEEETKTGTLYIEYYGTDGKLMNLSAGYASMTQVIDDAGRILSETYYNAEGEKAKQADGYDELRYEYNEQNQETRIRYYLDGEPMHTPDGIAAICREYDENRNIVSEKTFGTDGQPIARNEGYDEIRYEYNEKNQAIRIRYYLNGKPVLTPAGITAVGREYNAAGQVSKEWYLGRTVKTITTPAGVMSFTDGADGIPLKKLEVAIDPVQDLHGYDNPWPAGGGKNKYQMRTTDYTYAGIVIKANDDGTIDISGSTSDTAPSILIAENVNELRDLFAKGGTYTFSMNKGTYNANNFNISLAYKETENGSTIYIIPGQTKVVPAGSIFTTSNLWVAANKTVPTVTGFAIQLEEGSSQTSYTPYENICPISGWTGAEISRTGKNLIDKADLVNAGINPTTGETSYNQYRVCTGFIPVKSAQQYTVSYESGKKLVAIYFFDENKKTTSEYSTNTTVTIPTIVKYVRIVFGKVNDTEITTSELTNAQFEKGSVATAYEPFGIIIIYPITFPSSAGTVYGGTLTVNQDGTGELVVDKAEVDLGTVTWAGASSSEGRYYCDIPLKKLGYKNIICNQYKSVTADEMTTNPYSIRGSEANSNIVVRDMSKKDMTASDFKTAMSGVQLVYELATPVTYPLTAEQITTLLGTNNIWSDTGSILSCEYEVDLSLMDSDDQPSPVPNNKGVYQTAYDYDQSGRVIRESYLDADGQRMANTDGYIMVERKYDEAGNLIEEKGIRPE